MTTPKEEQIVTGLIRYEKVAPNAADIYARIREFAKAKEGYVTPPGHVGVLDGHTNWEAIMYAVPLHKGKLTRKEFINGLRAHVPELTEVNGETMAVPSGTIASIKAESAKLG